MSNENPVVTIETSMGALVVELDPAKATQTVANFLTYVGEGFYDGSDNQGATAFHRVIPNFMIQGGGITATGQPKPTHAPIALEADNGLTNVRGSIAMARTADPDSATAQFFINLADNAFLNHPGQDGMGGYTVFGRVISGMEVADAIVAVKTKPGDCPVEPIEILSVSQA